jgi:quinoprotein dehydrogenase-associated probable ABC transporter substrate-binding protein
METDLRSKVTTLAALVSLCAPLLLVTSIAASQQQPPPREDAQSAYIGGEKDFEDMSRQERDAAKAAARQRKFATLRVCADPGNMPFSNSRAEGFENKIAEALAGALGAQVTYAWRPTFERGLTRQTMTDLNICDIMVGVPTDYEVLLTTTPLYRSTYVLAYRNDKGFDVKSLKDPVLKRVRVGVYETSGLRNALANQDVKNNVIVMGTSHDADLVPEHQPWRQVEQVVDGQLDIAGVWGPFAGWVKETRHAPLTLVPTNLMDDTVPMEFTVAIGVRKSDAVVKYALEDAMEAKKQEIGAILKAYGVPLVQCSECLISGDLPAHGDYILEASEDESEDRPPERGHVSHAQVEKWLAEGSNVNDELGNAALAADLERVKYVLAKHGVDVNSKGSDGETPLHHAVINSDNEMIELLLAHKVRIDEPDSDGYTPLALAAARNKTRAIKLLTSRGANVEAQIPGGYTPLFIAVGEGKLAAAKALIDAGAKCDVVEGPQHFTLLMAIATQLPPERRIIQVMQQVGPVDLAQELLRHNADVNAVSTKGVTALIIAAAHDNAPMIGLLVRAGASTETRSPEGQTALDIATQNGNDSATRTLQLVKDSASVTGGLDQAQRP